MVVESLVGGGTQCMPRDCAARMAIPEIMISICVIKVDRQWREYPAMTMMQRD